MKYFYLFLILLIVSIGTYFVVFKEKYQIIKSELVNTSTERNLIIKDRKYVSPISIDYLRSLNIESEKI